MNRPADGYAWFDASASEWKHGGYNAYFDAFFDPVHHGVYRKEALREYFRILYGNDSLEVGDLFGMDEVAELTDWFSVKVAAFRGVYRFGETR